MASRDYEEFIAALNDHGVRYLIIGAHAVAFHARPRATKDLDILLDPTPANARRALAALRDFFGGADLGLRLSESTSFHSYPDVQVSRRLGKTESKLGSGPSQPIIWDSMI